MCVDLTSPAKTDAFGQKMLDTLNHAAVAMMTSIGHRTGLFDAMAQMAPATSDQIAVKTDLSERYVREWLGAMVTGGIIEHDETEQTYWLPAEHAGWLTRAAAPNNLAVAMQWIGLMGGVEDQVVDAFHHGRGVPYSSYHRFHEVMAEESAQTTVAGLEEHIVPLVPGLRERLEAGSHVLDVGCGRGLALLRLAALYPDSSFTGYDFSEEAISAARAEAVRLHLGNVRFKVKDVATMNAPPVYDLVTAFDAIHDQACPAEVLRNIARSLRRDGVFLMQDIAGSSCVHRNVGRPLAPFVYTVSCMHCMSVSLAHGGAGLGAAWGQEKALAMLEEAGFTNIRVEQLPHDILNSYYVASV